MTTIFWAGDSTVKQNSIATYPQTGIGQMFDRYIRRLDVRIENHAENGRSTKSFIDEGRLAPILARMREGDFLFIQFGHNDEKIADPTRYADPERDYPANLERFVSAAREKGATPVLITPLTRYTLGKDDPSLRHDRWAQAMRDTAKRLDVALIDLYAMSERYVADMGERARTTLYMNLPEGVYPHFPKGQRDDTHLQPAGALAFGGLIAKALHALGGQYAGLLCEEYDEWIVESETVGGVETTADDEVER